MGLTPADAAREACAGEHFVARVAAGTFFSMPQSVGAMWLGDALASKFVCQPRSALPLADGRLEVLEDDGESFHPRAASSQNGSGSDVVFCRLLHSRPGRAKQARRFLLS
jgi:hypothetical protein